MGKIERVALSNLITKSLSNRYEILSVVGAGTYGCVYKARKVDPASTAFFALKKIDTSKETEGVPFPFNPVPNNCFARDRHPAETQSSEYRLTRRSYHRQRLYLFLSERKHNG